MKTMIKPKDLSFLRLPKATKKHQQQKSDLARKAARKKVGLYLLDIYNLLEEGHLWK